MIYSTLITTASGGNAGSPVRTTLKITRGLIWLMEVYMPPGCVGLVHIQVFDGKYQLLPASPGETISGDGQLLRYDDTYLKESAPFELTVVTWNEDEVNPHDIQVRIGLAASRLFMARYLPSIAWEDFALQLEQVKEDQKKLQAEQLKEMLDTITTE